MLLILLSAGGGGGEGYPGAKGKDCYKKQTSSSEQRHNEDTRPDDKAPQQAYKMRMKKLRTQNPMTKTTKKELRSNEMDLKKNEAQTSNDYTDEDMEMNIKNK